MLFIHSYKTIFCFPTIIMYILATAIKKMTANELRDFMYENYYKPVGFNVEITHNKLKCQKKRFTIICEQINGKNS